MVELKLWHPGRVTVTVRGVRRFAARASAGQCALTRLRLPRAHGTAVVTARAFGGSERRTLRF
jgi:hypothetical protein